MKQQRLPCSKPFSTAHRAKPVRPVWETGQTGFFLDSREEHSPRENSTLSPIDLSIRSTDQSETLGIVGVPCGLPLARSSVPKTHSIKRNRKSTLKNTSKPRTPKTPKSSPFAHGFGRGITDQRTTKGSHKFPPSNPKNKVPKTTQRNHQERAPKITTKNNREQHIQTLRNHAESSIHATKVHTRSSLPPNHPTLSKRSHHEALKLVLEILRKMGEGK
jgi:hypothetical protein